MKKITLFFMPGCPHCQKAMRFIRELQAENPAYAAVEFELIDETKQVQLANSFDYYYVPCFYDDKLKLHEGTLTRQDVVRVFEHALNA